MFNMTERLQTCIGYSLIILSIGGTWSMMTGSIVKFQVAGANFSVNEKLKQVENVAMDLEQTTLQLKDEPGVSRLKLRAIEREIEQVQSEIETTESHIEHDLEKLVNQTEM